mmetsp:Transcript_13400/g.34175  ORF Transcript_13400/g.34175 Transcript_13400/m.34175 type:complete len:206 (-) Transcript_13400:81-698(-)|eukprot:CAMPEP_0177685530 /NCGR_PEP_ID=MMETSP0447-20121125/33085_1 /TAXON_ID=0 /ORGANISM="Stygamoeba regulata, Strain BSH-02190019" /LENGTH=205 /DNA_ID=CAMNT_0019195593 /DNA_START=226 /DNA_END=843 /DNA_ORIENTATION=+
MSNKGEQIANLNFEALISAPLVAAIEAQVQANMVTSEYVKMVGFKQSLISAAMAGVGNPLGGAMQSFGEPQMVHFQFKKKNAKTNADEDWTLSVPFLTMVPIPNMRITDMRLDFNVRINTQDTVDYTTGNWKKVDGIVRNSQTDVNGNTRMEDFSMRIAIEAKAPEMPRGLERVLDILEGAIMDQVKQEKAAGPAKKEDGTEEEP